MLTAVLLGLLQVAQADPGPPTAPRSAPTAVPAALPHAAPVPGAPTTPRTCADIEADARALLAGAQACDGDGACEVVALAPLVGTANCVAAFQCSAALPVDFDRDAFVAAATALVTEKRACNECAVASCVPPSLLQARCEAGHCVLQAR